MSKAITSGRVILEPHNVLDEEKRRGASCFFVRFVIREWSDAHAVKILTNVGYLLWGYCQPADMHLQLHRASSTTTKLILVERVVTDWSMEDESAERPEPEILAEAIIPPHLRASFGGGLEQTGRPLLSLLDAQVCRRLSRRATAKLTSRPQLMLYTQGRERTLEELAGVLTEAKWQIKSVTRAGTSSLAQIVCAPIPTARKEDAVRPEPDMEE